jgi:hypothetical protein
MGHADLSWAFSEAAVLGWRANPAGQKSLTRVEKTHETGKALTVLAHQLARAVSSMFKRAVTFDRCCPLSLYSVARVCEDGDI